MSMSGSGKAPGAVPETTHADPFNCHCSKTWAIVDGQWRIVVNGPMPDCPQHGTFARTGTPYDMGGAR